MLKIDYGCSNDAIFSVDYEFEDYFEMNWLNDPFTKRVLDEIDNCHIENGIMVDNDQGYTFSIFEISGGAKALLLCYYLDNVKIHGILFGDNCTNLLLEIAENKDIIIYLEHFLQFNPEKFKAFSILKNRAYKDYKEYFDELSLELVREYIYHD